MQITINSIFDSSLDKRNSGRVAKGIRQVCKKHIFKYLLLNFNLKGNRKKRRFISYAYDG
jgi:hypothetical protein